MGKFTISMVIFHSYVKLPEGTFQRQSHLLYRWYFQCYLDLSQGFEVGKPRDKEMGSVRVTLLQTPRYSKPTNRGQPQPTMLVDIT